MKKVLKGLFAILLIGVVSISLTGCGGKNNDDILNNTENNNKQNEEKKNNKDENDSSSDEVKLYSDDTKIVFNVGDVYYVVYYHDGVNVTGMEYVYSYPDAETAKFAETMLKATYEENNGVKSLKRSGKQIKIVFDEDTYRGLTVEQAKTTYSMYEEMYKN